MGSVRVQVFNAETPQYQTLRNWTITGFSFDNHASIERFVKSSLNSYVVSSDGNLYDGPVVFHGEFDISDNEQIHNTYWDAQGWGKGFVFVNGFNLGRYWPLVGPQITLFVPKELLKHGKNEIQVVELQKAPANLRMNFVNGPIFINDEKS